MFAVPLDAASDPDSSGTVLLKQCEFGEFYHKWNQQIDTSRFILESVLTVHVL